ncbi:MAG TPA: DUF2393 family protein [Acidobacteriaceae bacterium]|nr:DUF2393 family protein [Acidobacteriaceae bacterium]
MTDGAGGPNFLGAGSGRNGAKEPRPILPWAIAGTVVGLIVAIWLVLGSAPKPLNPGGPGLAPPAAYAKNLTISNIKMSTASTIIGATQTYVDGDITNHGDKTLTGVTVQVAFHGFTGPIAQKNAMPMELIRTREPVIDIEPVSASPIAPGQTKSFHLIFDHVSADWNQQYPEIRVIAVETK